MKPTILIADDEEVDRRILIGSFRRLAPGEFDILEHDQASTLLAHLLDIRPDLLVLDRVFAKDQDKRPDYEDHITFAKRIRENYPVLDQMAVVVYSRYWNSDEEAAKYSNDHKTQRLWARRKDTKHQLIVEHVRSILSPP